MKSRPSTAILVSAALVSGDAIAGEAGGPGEPPASDREAAIRILPVRDYSGDLATRSTLTGDWGGARNDLARRGVFFAADVTFTASRIGSGGKDVSLDPRLPGLRSIDVGPDRGANGGSFVGLLDVDTGAAGMWPGGLVHAKFSSRWGSTLNDDAGAILPVDTGSALPAGPDRSEAALTAWNLTQFLSPQFGVALGKFDTTETDPNPLASNERDTFQNISLLYPTVGLRTLPDSALGAGLVWLPRKETVVSVLAADSEGEATRSGFDTIDQDGTTITPLVTNRTGLFGLPGGQRVGGTWSNAHYTSLEQDPRVAFLAAAVLGRAPKTGTNSWCVFADGWQYVETWEDAQDLGWGVFWRLGAADPATNFIERQYAGGVGGKGGLLCREHDSWGVGVFLTGLSDELRQAHLTDEKGFEAFYSVGITPWMHLTPSVQVVDPGIREFDTVLIGSLRLQIDF